MSQYWRYGNPRRTDAAQMPATMNDIAEKLDTLIKLQLETRPTGRHYSWEFTLYGGSETVTTTTYDPTTDSYSSVPVPGSGKNTVILNFVSGRFSGRSISDVATPFIFPYRPLYAVQIVNEIPAGAVTGADIRISLNNPKQDYQTPVLIRTNDSYSTGIMNGPTFIRMSAVNVQPTNTAVDAYVRVIGMA